MWLMASDRDVSEVVWGIRGIRGREGHGRHAGRQARREVRAKHVLRPGERGDPQSYYAGGVQGLTRGSRK
jgi:hypothetical protein